MHGIILSWICDLPAFLALLWVPVVERGGARLFCPKRERPKKKKTYGVQEGTFGWKDCQLI